MTLDIIQLIGVFITSGYGFVCIGNLVNGHKVAARSIFAMSLGITMVFAGVIF